MTLELSKLTPELHAMGADLAARARTQAALIDLARRWLGEYAGEEAGTTAELARAARAVRAAIPTDEPVDAIIPDPGTPDRFTVVGVDGSQMEPDRHGVAYFHLINVGSLVYRHGSGRAPDPQSTPSVGYSEVDIYEDGSPVAGNLLDVRRDLAEITQVADLCESETRSPVGASTPVPVVGLVDGTLLLWVLDDRSPARKAERVLAYVDQLDRIRATGATLGAFTSRPRRAEVTRLLHLSSTGCDPERAKREPNALEHVPDRAVFGTLPPGARSALFVSPSPLNHQHYAPARHTIYFCYVNVAGDQGEPVVARVEMPEWVAQDPTKRDLLHGSIVSQSRIAGEYPYSLARADELAFITGQEREIFADMVATALVRAGARPALSPKANLKALTRGGRRRRR